MDEIANARAAMFLTAIRMHQIFGYLATHEEIPTPAALFVGKVLVTIARYCNITNEIIDNPAAEPDGYRCMFY